MRGHDGDMFDDEREEDQPATFLLAESERLVAHAEDTLDAMLALFNKGPKS